MAARRGVRRSPGPALVFGLLAFLAAAWQLPPLALDRGALLEGDHDAHAVAVRLVTQVGDAFQAAVFTRSLDTALQCYRQLDASAVMVNDHTAFRVDWMPFAGLRQSGLGVGGIPYTFHDMQIEKMLVVKSDAL